MAQTAASIAVNNGVELRVSASFGNPTGEQTVKVELAHASGNSFYRIFRDQNNLAVFAYELVINRNADGTEFSIAAKPVEEEFAARYPNADGGKPVPTLSSDKTYPSLRAGAKVEIGLFELAGVGLRVVDTVQVRVTQGGSALDVPITSGQIRLRFSGLRVSVNGTNVAAAPPHGSVSGRYLMFYLPGRGAYFFSTSQPMETGFLKAGSIEGNRLRFAWDNEMYEANSESPILVGVPAGEVWVYRDAAYRPQGNWTENTESTPGATSGFFTAAADSLNWWLP